MRRVPISDERDQYDGTWIDQDAAKVWEEPWDFDRQGRALGRFCQSPSGRVYLLRSRLGAWIFWHLARGSAGELIERFRRASSDAVAKWFSMCRIAPPPGVAAAAPTPPPADPARVPPVWNVGASEAVASPASPGQVITQGEQPAAKQPTFISRVSK
jgi:hypothetical protein